MTRTTAPPPALAGTVFRARDALASRLVTPAGLRGSAWRRMARGVYADAALPDSHALRCAASVLALPSGVIVAGRSAADLHGAATATASDPVELLVPTPLRVGAHAGVVVHAGAVEEAEWEVHAGLPVTTPLRTCWDLAQWLAPPDAVALVDRLLAAGRVRPADLAAYGERCGQARGHRRYRRVVELADDMSGSPQESRLRVRLIMAGVPAPVTQFVVTGEQGFAARVDFAWPDLKVAMEYDGLWHVGSARRMGDDRRRLNQLVAAGWCVLHVTADRLRYDFDRVVAELQAVIRTRRPPR
jgi:hypothetical protein